MEFVKTADNEHAKILKGKKDRNVLRSTTTRTVNFDNSMTAAVINAKINEIHKHLPYGAALTFQFADGTYNLTETIIFSGFYGAGTLLITGNAVDYLLSTGKAVFLDFSAGQGVYLYRCSCTVQVFGLKVRTNTTTLTRQIYIRECSKFNQIYYNYCLGSSLTNGAGIYAYGASHLYCYGNYVSNSLYGIVSYLCSHIASVYNPSTGTNPAYGLYCYASIIMKNLGQPTGSTANELASHGGLIQ